MSLLDAVRIADKCRAHLLSNCEGLSNLHAIFTIILRAYPRDTDAHALASLGILEANDWMERADKQAEAVRTDLDSLDFGGAQ